MKFEALNQSIPYSHPISSFSFISTLKCNSFTAAFKQYFRNSWGQLSQNIMKKNVLFVFALFLIRVGFSQSYSSPESIEFDNANNRWFIANNGGNNILTRSSETGELAVFASSGFSGGGPHGLEIVEDTLYACAGGSLRAYNINSGALVFTKNLGGSFLNGITHDTSGNLYITDFSGNRIYRFNTRTRNHNIFVAGGVSSPNGIIYDQENNRCVFVQWTGAIRAVSLVDSTVSTLLPSSGLNSVDGITKDGAGNYYVSSWSPTRITRYNSTFATPTTAVGAGMGLSNPADIFYNVLTDTLGVPNSGSGNNTTYYYFGTSTSTEKSANNDFKFSVFPNPIFNKAEIKYQLARQGNVKIEISDVCRKVVKTIANESQAQGFQLINFDKSGLSAGIYFFTIRNENGAETKKVAILD